MQRAERNALLTILGLALTGQVIRAVVGHPGDAPGAVRLDGSAAAGRDPGAHRDSAQRSGRPLSAGERIDVDLAPAAELVRLPRVGPVLAKAIVADRTARGPFGGLEALGRVRGVGPGLLRAIESHVRFSGTPSPEAAPSAAITPREPMRGPVASRTPLDLNLAREEDLVRLPGIGATKARAILETRKRLGGRFSKVEDLHRVPGVGPKTVEKLKGMVAVD
ncbi:MAG: ComEA family DNA-binding protein [Gemmatimonadales bacterium]